MLSGCRPPTQAADRQAFTEHLVPEEECEAPGPATLDRPAIERDLAVLVRLFERGYAGYAQSPAQRWRAAHEAARRGVRDRMSIAELRDHLAETYGFLDDNHVGFWFFDPERQWRATGGHESPYLGPPLEAPGEGPRRGEERALTSCDAPLRPFAGEGGVGLRPIVLAREAPEALRCRGPAGEVDSPLEPLTSFVPAAGPAFERNGGRVVLRSLMTPDADALERFVASAATLRQEPLVVLDMRSTGGGADRYLARFFARFAGRELRYWTTGTLVSETTLQGAANFWRCVRASRPDAGDGGRRWLDRRIARADRELHESARRGPFYDFDPSPKVVLPTEPEPFTGRLLVVTGPQCASACETTVLLARQVPGTWIVGQNTHGTMKVGELAWYRLPESRIWVALGRRAHTDPLGRFEEGRGFLPDVWIDGQDADARLDELIACAGDSRCAGGVDALIRSTPPGSRDRPAP